MNPKTVLRAAARTISYGLLIGGAAYPIHDIFFRSRPTSSASISSMANIGADIGDGLLVIAITFASFLLASLFNAADFFLAVKPRAGGRKFELAIFQIPLLLIVAIFMLFAFTFGH
jgi:hypothetical protein